MTIKVNYILTRSKRKTVALYIRNGGLEVRAPLKVSKHDIDRFVVSKENWIKDRLTRSKEQLTRRENFSLDYGDLITYRGKQYPVAEKICNGLGFDGKQFYISPGLQPEQIKAACIQIYRTLAKHDLTEKTLNFAKKMSVVPSVVKINGAKTRWGSCSSKRSLNFSWRLIMAEEEVIDYVIVHELAHILEMNHSEQFWAIVEKVLPDYRKRKAKLKQLHQKLSEENWDLP